MNGTLYIYFLTQIYNLITTYKRELYMLLILTAFVAKGRFPDKRDRGEPACPKVWKKYEGETE